MSHSLSEAMNQIAALSQASGPQPSMDFSNVLNSLLSSRPSLDHVNTMSGTTLTSGHMSLEDTSLSSSSSTSGSSSSDPTTVSSGITLDPLYASTDTTSGLQGAESLTSTDPSITPVSSSTGTTGSSSSSDPTMIDPSMMDPTMSTDPSYEVYADDSTYTALPMQSSTTPSSSSGLDGSNPYMNDTYSSLPDSYTDPTSYSGSDPSTSYPTTYDDPNSYDALSVPMEPMTTSSTMGDSTNPFTNDYSDYSMSMPVSSMSPPVSGGFTPVAVPCTSCMPYPHFMDVQWNPYMQGADPLDQIMDWLSAFHNPSFTSMMPYPYAHHIEINIHVDVFHPHFTSFSSYSPFDYLPQGMNCCAPFSPFDCCHYMTLPSPMDFHMMPFPFAQAPSFDLYPYPPMSMYPNMYSDASLPFYSPDYTNLYPGSSYTPDYYTIPTVHGDPFPLYGADPMTSMDPSTMYPQMSDPTMMYPQMSDPTMMYPQLNNALPTTTSTTNPFDPTFNPTTMVDPYYPQSSYYPQSGTNMGYDPMYTTPMDSSYPLYDPSSMYSTPTLQMDPIGFNTMLPNTTTPFPTSTPMDFMPSYYSEPLSVVPSNTGSIYDQAMLPVSYPMSMPTMHVDMHIQYHSHPCC